MEVCGTKEIKLKMLGKFVMHLGKAPQGDVRLGEERRRACMAEFPDEMEVINADFFSVHDQTVFFTAVTWQNFTRTGRDFVTGSMG